MHERTVCTAVNRANRDCDGPVPHDSPVSLCWKHLIMAYGFVRDSLRDERLVSDTAHERRKYEPKVVYYLGFGDRVKIGSTADLLTRLGHIPHDEVLAVEPGDVALERQRHNEFARLHIRGEWYEAHPSLLEHAARIREQHPGLLP